MMREKKEEEDEEKLGQSFSLLEELTHGPSSLFLRT
jgi:hypothetical protein